jgi:hypothetical protein
MFCDLERKFLESSRISLTYYILYNILLKDTKYGYLVVYGN